MTTQLQPALANVQPAVGASRPVNPHRGSRWEARNDNRKEDVTRARPDNDRPQREGRDQFGRDRPQREGRDQFGRDRPVERHREREPERSARVTESPASNVGASSTSRSRYRPSDNILRYEVLK